MGRPRPSAEEWKKGRGGTSPGEWETEERQGKEEIEEKVGGMREDEERRGRGPSDAGEGEFPPGVDRASPFPG